MSKARSGSDTAQPTPKVLVVDDEVALLNSLAELLRLNRYEVETANSGRMALERLTACSYDVVLLDLRMEDISGHDVLEYVRDFGLSCTVVVVSGESSFDAVTRAVLLGAHDYVRKPYIPDELLTTVANAVMHRRLEAENQQFQQKLRESEKLHRYLVEQSPDVVYLLGRDGRFVFVNSRAESLLGYRKTDLLRKHYSEVIEEVIVLDGTEAAEASSDMERARRQFMARVRTKAGDLLHLEIETFPVEFDSMPKAAVEGAELGAFDGIFGIARDVSDRKRAEDTIHFQAYHDLLTGLPNRSLFKDRIDIALAHAKRNQSMLAVMFIDLDRFKVINDTLGHAAGDELLQAVSTRLRSCLREGDTLSRFGGDEFTLLLPHIQAEEDALQVTRKIRSQLDKPFAIDGNEVFLGASIGISVYPKDGSSMNALVKNADMAMYQIKQRGRNGFQFYHEEMDGLSGQRLTLEGDMRKALETGQFSLYFQPQVSIQDGTIVGMEALVRWQHPFRGLLFPGEFITIAEDSGLVVSLGEQVLRQALAHLRGWIDQGLDPIRIGVNCSSLQIEQPGFEDLVLGVLEEFALDPRWLEIEITENLLLRDLERVASKLSVLAQAGVSIALDDFGTGFSSLSYLQQFPLHTLKVDRTFVQDIRDLENDIHLVDAIASIAKGLRLNLVAEGVETEAQFNYLRRIGCHEVQGFLFSRPVDAEHAGEMLRSSQQRLSGVPA